MTAWNRLDRRTIILRGKREGAFDSDQYWMEAAKRERQARRLRVALRTTRPAVVIAPRWSQVQRFLDDVASDLAIEEPEIIARTLALQGLKGLTAHQAWGWLAAAIAEFCQITLAEGPAWQAVSRHGFRSVVTDLLEQAEDGPARCLMIHGMEHLQVEAVRDLIEVFEAHCNTHEDRRFNLLLAGAIDAPHFGFEGAERVELVDYSDREAVEALVEHFGPVDAYRLKAIVSIVGGVPALIDALGHEERSELVSILQNRETLWKVLGPVGEEVRAALDIVNADGEMARRLERLARKGELPEEAELDARLISAGLVRRHVRKSGAVTQIRTPWFADLALAS